MAAISQTRTAREPADVDDLTGPPLSRGYKPSLPPAFFWTDTGLPRSRVIADLEAMLVHPQCKRDLGFYKSGIANARITVTKASSSEVGEFAQTEIDRFWAEDRGTAQQSYDYGWGGYEVGYEIKDGRYRQSGLIGFHPLDCNVLLVDQGYAGFRLRGLQGRGEVDLWGPPGPDAKADGSPYGLAKGFWFAHNPRYSRWYGRTQLQAAHRPWRRLAGRNGAEDVIDGGFYRFGLKPVVVSYPAGRKSVQASNQQAGATDQTNRDRARQIGTEMKSGASVAIPSEYDDKGNKLWDLQVPDSSLDMSGVMDWEERLSKLITIGIEVPPEILEASDTGSGYSGRMIPLQAYFTGQQQNAQSLFKMYKLQILDPLIRWNFGPEAFAEADIEPLLASHQRATQGQDAAPGQSMPGDAPAGSATAGQQPPTAPGRVPPNRQPNGPPAASPAGGRTLSLQRFALEFRDGFDGGTDPLAGSLVGRLAALADAAKAEVLAAGPANLAVVFNHYRDQLAGLLAGAMTEAHAAAAESVPDGISDAAEVLRGLSDDDREAVISLFSEDKAAKIRAAVAPENNTPVPAHQFPALGRGAAALRSRTAVTRPEFDALTDAARRQAFTVAGDLAEDAIAAVRDELAESVTGPTDLRAFKKAVADVPFLSPEHLETVFRSNVQAALSDGLEATLADPAVGSGFPYRAYDPVHDSRARHDHLALEKRGLDGTNVYRADDPVWEKYRPPWDFQCRCGWRPLSVEQAAGMGVKEAIEWHRTGAPPAEPAHVPMPDFGPTSGYVRMALSALPKRAKEAGHWITIGAKAGADGQKHGGTPVYVENGRITKGAPGLHGKKIGALEEESDTTHRQELHAAKGHSRAVHAKTARKEGYDPGDLHQLAAEMLAHHNESAAQTTKLLQRARQLQAAPDRTNLNALAANLRHGRIDHSMVKGFDQTADELHAEFPGMLRSDDKAGHLWEMLSAGNPEPMAEDDAYSEALDYMRRHMEPRGKVKKEKDVPDFAFGANE